MLRIAVAVLSLVALAQTPADTRTASMYFTVRDGKNHLVSRINSEDFLVLEDGIERPIHSISRATAPIDVGVLLDASTGVIPTLQTEAEAATSFFQAVMRPGDLGFTISYNSQVSVLQAPAEDTRLLERNTARVSGYGRYVAAPQPKSIPLQPVPTPMPIPLPRPLPGTPPVPRPAPPSPIPGQSGRSPGALRIARLYDAVMLAANRFVARENGRSVIVVLALADDAHSTATLDDALRALKKRGITAYVLEVEAERVGVGSILETVARRSTRIRRDDFDIPNVFSGDSQVRIARLAEETGGRMIRVKGFGKLRSAFAEIAEDLRQQLVVTFTPSNVTDAGLRHLEIQTRIKRGRVYAANGYYVTPKPQP